MKHHSGGTSSRGSCEFGKGLLHEKLASEKDLLNDPVTDPNLDDGGRENGDRQEEPDCGRAGNGRNQVCRTQCPVTQACYQEESEHSDPEPGANDADALQIAR